MAQIEKTAEPELLHWDLWEKDKTNKLVVPAIHNTKLTNLGRPVLVYCLLALAVMLPLLLPGFILTLDMSFTPELRMPEYMSSSYLFHTALHYLNDILPADIIQKILLFSILLLSGLGMHFLVRHIQDAKDKGGEFALWGAHIAGALYMINPFTYSRFMTGQYAVLLGYALLPFFVLSLLRFFVVPTLRRALVASVWLTLIGIVSVHSLGLAAVLIFASLITCVWRCRRNYKIALNAVIFGFVGIATFVLASGYWLFPLLSGSSNQGQAVSQFNANDIEAFKTVGDGVVGQVGNILQLQGFWAEAQSLYLLPQEQLPGWGVVVLLIWIMVGIGVCRLWRNYRWLAALFSIASLAAIILAVVGLGNSQLLGGFREPHKFIGLLALAYALFVGFGATSVLAWGKKRGDAIFSCMAVLIVLLPVLFTPTMFWGFSNQLSPRHYPTDWYQMNSQLNQDASDFRVLSLPWHLYMYYPFAERVIVNPSDKFFDKPTVISNELEFKNASPTFPSDTKSLLTSRILPSAGKDINFGKKLTELNIKYILLAKTNDYQEYQYLNERDDLQLITETPNLKLYRNLSYE